MRTIKVDVPTPPADRVTLEALREVVGPEGDMTADKLMVPLNPFKLERMIVELLEVPAGMIKLVGLENAPKSPPRGGLTVTVTMTVWANPPLVPVTVIT